MTKNILGMAPPCAHPDHPLAACRPASTQPLSAALARALAGTLAELLAGETYRHGLSPHLRRDIGLPE